MEKKSNYKDCSTWEEMMYWKNFNSMHFFLTLDKNCHDHLVLPEKFAAHMSTQLPDKVSLTGPSGLVWDIELERTDKRRLLFVGDGWKDFVRANDLDENCLLIFKYERNSGFEVLLLDQESLCEKEASYFVKECRLSSSEPHKEVKKHKGTVRAGSNTDAEAAAAAADDDEDDISEPLGSKKSKNFLGETAAPRRRGRGRPRKLILPSDSSEESSDRNEATQEKNPISVRYMTPINRESFPEKGHAEGSKDNSGQELQLSENDTADENPNQVSSRELIMLNHSKTSHEANHSKKPSRKRGRPTKQPAPKSKNSSRKQVSKRTVLVKKVCSAKKNYSKVYVSNRREVTKEEKDEAFERALINKTENCFMVVLPPSSVYRRFYLSIPADWMNGHLPLQNKYTILRVGDNVWHTKFSYIQDRKAGGFTAGWKQFAVDNSLEESDVLLFKLADQNLGEAILFDVEIFRVVPEIVPPVLADSSTLTA